MGTVDCGQGFPGTGVRNANKSGLNRIQFSGLEYENIQTAYAYIIDYSVDLIKIITLVGNIIEQTFFC